MDCPVCRLEMMGLELEGVEIDFCPDCRGVWLDEGELEELAGDAAAAAELVDAAERARRSGEKRHRCPRCYRKMAKVRLGEDPGVILDRCHHGLWFDRGELTHLFETHLAGQAAHRMSRFLKELLGDGA